MTNNKNQADNAKAPSTPDPGQETSGSELQNNNKKQSDASQALETDRQLEHGGAKGPEPTRYGDWEHNGRCTDF